MKMIGLSSAFFSYVEVSIMLEVAPIQCHLQICWQPIDSRDVLRGCVFCLSKLHL
jgi:hypothetical protein